MDIDAGGIGDPEEPTGGNPGDGSNSASIFGGSVSVDPNAFGGRGNRGGSSDGTGGSNPGDSGGNGGTGGNGGSDTVGPYGLGYHPDGRPRKRRPRGSGGTPGVSTGRKDRAPLPLEPHAVEGYLIAIHAIASAALEKHLPEQLRVIPLEKDDAGNLSRAICNVARHYPMMVASQKYVDLGALIFAAGSVYIPMVLLYRENSRKYHAWLAAEMAKRQQAADMGEMPL